MASSGRGESVGSFGPASDIVAVGLRSSASNEKENLRSMAVVRHGDVSALFGQTVLNKSLPPLHGPINTRLLLAEPDDKCVMLQASVHETYTECRLNNSYCGNELHSTL